MKTETASQTQEKEPGKVKKFFIKIGNWKFFRWCANVWTKFKTKHPNIAQFLVFFILSNGVTILQLAMMPIFKALFELTDLVNIDFRIWQVGKNFDGSTIMCLTRKRTIMSGGARIGVFLAAATDGIAQVINFFAQEYYIQTNNNIWWSHGMLLT